MFKKTLLAMTIAGASASTMAGVLSADVTETLATRTAANAAAGAATDCAAFATTYDATVTLGAFKVAAPADTITVAADAGTAGVYSTTANTMVYTADDACTLTINKDILVAASDAKYSIEGAAANGVSIDAKLSAGIGGFSDEDTIILTVTGGVIDEDASAAAALVSDKAAPSTFTLLGVVGSTILFTVDAGAQVAREIIDISGIVVTPNEGASSVSISAATQNTANVQYDKTAATQLVVLDAQYTASVMTKFDGIIDVATARTDIAVNTDDNVTGGEAANQDTAVVKVTEVTTQGNLDSDKVVLVLSGDFSWMMDLDLSDDDKAITSAELQTGFTYNAFTDKALTLAGDDVVSKAELNEAMNKLTVTIDTTAGTDDVDAYHSFTWVVPGTDDSTSLNEQTFVATLTSYDGTDTATIASGVNLGEWTLNGSVVEVPYMPFGPNTQPILRHTNTGVQTGDISARYMLEGVDTTWKSVGVVIEDAAPGLHNLLAPVMDAVVAATGKTSGKVALEITTNVPGDDVTVFAAAKVTTSDSDRLTIGAFSN